jgi:tetratricopeptide (TPR) repeat protein
MQLLGNSEGGDQNFGLLSLSMLENPVKGYLLTLNKPIKAQEQLGCFMLNSSGQLINLNAFCGQSERSGSSDLISSQEVYQRGFSYARAGFLDDAINDFTQAISIDPAFLEAYIARAYARSQIGDIQGGIEDFQRVVSIYRSRGEIEKADAFEELIRNIER